MELLLYAVIFSMILIVSNATNKLVPSLPLPLIQILLGIGWALFCASKKIFIWIPSSFWRWSLALSYFEKQKKQILLPS